MSPDYSFDMKKILTREHRHKAKNEKNRQNRKPVWSQNSWDLCFNEQWCEDQTKEFERKRVYQAFVALQNENQCNWEKYWVYKLTKYCKNMSLKQHGSLCRWICSLQWTFISFSHIEGITNDDLRGTLRLHSPRSPVNNNVPVLWHFRKSKLNRTQLNRTKLKVKTDAKDDHGKTRGDMNVTPRTDASKFKSGGTFALIVLKSCGHFKVGEKYHNLAWVENKHVWNSSGARFARWLFFLFASRPFCPSITLSCKVNKKNP